MAIKNSVTDITRLASTTDDGFRYNCGGFALANFEWYRPYDNEFMDYMFWDELPECFATWEDYNDYLLSETVNYMLENIDGLRRIKTVSNLKPNEYAIAYRVGAEIEDFHFMRRSDEGIWYEKQGWGDIHEVPEDYVFASEWELTPEEFYESDIVLLAKTK